MSRRSVFLCLDCGKDTGKMREYYFVHTELWLSAVGSKNGMLCVGCLETRIGRKLKKADFADVFINRLNYGHSMRLLDRLKN